MEAEARQWPPGRRLLSSQCERLALLNSAVDRVDGTSHLTTIDALQAAFFGCSIQLLRRHLVLSRLSTPSYDASDGLAGELRMRQRSRDDGQFVVLNFEQASLLGP